MAAGLVLCGGSAQLAGFRELAVQLLNLPVRVGAPHNLQGLTDTLENPAYATAVGVLQWALQQGHEEISHSRARRPPSEFWRKVREWLAVFLPG